MSQSIDRIVIVGLGSIGMRHLRLARQIFPEADIRVLRRAPSIVRAEFSDGEFYNLKDAICFKPNIAVLANPASEHVSNAIEFAQAGIHLLVEKPLSLSAFGVRKLLDIALQKNIKLLVGYNLRFSSSLIAFRQMIQSGRIGRVTSIRSEVGQDLRAWRPGSDYRKSVSAVSKLGGGVLLELSHEIDYLQWIFGDIFWVQAAIGKQGDLEIDVEDTAHLIFGIRRPNAGDQIIGTLNMDFLRTDATRFCVAIGSEGSLRWNGITGEVDCFRSITGKWESVISANQERDQSYLAEWHALIDSIKNESNSTLNGFDSLKVLSVIDAARQSSADGCKKMVPNS